MGGKRRSRDRRALLNAKLTELMLLAKELCPEATVKANTIQYEEEDGHVDVFPPSTLPEDDIDRLITALADRTAKIYDDTGLFLVFAVLN
jgi:hypothetical protein